MKTERLGKLKLASNVVHIWKTRLTHDENIEPYLAVLSSEEKERAEKFRFSKHKNSFVKTRGLQRVLLSHYLQKDTQDILIEYGSHGKPYCTSELNLRFNASHSGEMILLAFTKDHEVGIDVEEIKIEVDVDSVSKHFFSDQEIIKLRTIQKALRQEAFFTCWSRKEAFIKAIGDGLSFPLDQFEVSFKSNEPAQLLQTKWNEKEKSIWTIIDIPMAKDYKGALAIKALKQKIIYYTWD